MYEFAHDAIAAPAYRRFRPEDSTAGRPGEDWRLAMLHAKALLSDAGRWGRSIAGGLSLT